jgi:flagellin
MTSVITNPGAITALRNLSIINFNLQKTENRVSTGLKVNSPVDDAGDFAIAQGLRADLKAFDAVQQALSSGSGIASVAVAAATSISSLLGDINTTVISATNTANTTSQQSILAATFASQLTQLGTFVANAVFNGRNLISAGSSNVTVTSSISGGQLTLTAASTLSQVSAALTAGVATTSAATALLTAVTAQQLVVGSALGTLGSNQNNINFLSTFVQALSDATTQGLGTLVDADLAAESAKLTALQVQQQLAVQALNIANQTPQVLLSLFKSG